MKTNKNKAVLKEALKVKSDKQLDNKAYGLLNMCVSATSNGYSVVLHHPNKKDGYILDLIKDI